MPGNTSDKETQMPFIRKLEEKYGRIGSLWLMDRGVPSEKTLKEMRNGGYRYLVGAPRGHLKVLGDKLKKSDWQKVQEGVDVKMAKADDVTTKDADGRETTAPGDTFVLTRSAARSLKETSMRAKRIRGAMKKLFKLDDRIEAHIFTAFMALCLLQTLRAIAREHAPAEDFKRSCRIGENDSVVKTYEQNPSKRWGFARERGKSG